MQKEIVWESHAKAIMGIIQWAFVALLLRLKRTVKVSNMSL